MTPGERRLLTHLLRDQDDPTGWIRIPSAQTLAAALHVTDRSIRRWLMWLEKRKLVQRRRLGRRGLALRFTPKARRIAADETRRTRAEEQALVEPLTQPRQLELFEEAFAAVTRDRAAAVALGQKQPLKSPKAYRAKVFADWTANPETLVKWLERARGGPSPRATHRDVKPENIAARPARYDEARDINDRINRICNGQVPAGA